MNDIKQTIIYEKNGEYKKAYGNAFIPTEPSNNSYEDMRRNVELSVLYFLELGRPHNSPYGHETHDMHHLALYYDMLNNVPKEEQKEYYVVKTERDPYDGGTNDYHIIYDSLIIETLQKEAVKNDVVALGCLAVQFAIDPQHSNFKLENIDDILKRLLFIAENGNKKDSGMAYYFLGRYYENEIELNELLCRATNEENRGKAKEYFELALEKNFHLAITHLVEDILKEHSKEESLKILEIYEKYVPYIRWSKAGKYHEILEELRK